MKRSPLAIALTLFLPSLASAAPSAGSEPRTQVRRAEVAAPPAAAHLPAVGTLGAKEQGILKKLGGMGSGQIAELLEAYARMGNRRMASHLSQELLRRDPRNSRSRELADSILDDATSTPDDPAARAAEEFMARRQPGKAARVLAELKAGRFAGRVFPWQEDLAYAWYEAGQVPFAKAAFEEIIRTPGYPEAARAEALKAVRMIMVDSLTKAGDAALSRRESREAMRLAEQLLAANPADPDAVALKAGAYSAAGQPRQAIDYLLSLKGAAPGLFPHQMALAAAYQDARMFAAARAAYQVFLTDPAATSADRAEASARLVEMEREARLIAGDHALRTGQLARAESILTELEAAGPGQPEVAAFRAALQMKRRQYGNARETLTKLRERSDARNEFFESRDDLAEALAATGSPHEAAAEYAMVKDDPRFDKLSRYEASRRYMELNGRLRPGLSQTLEVANEAEGTRVGATNEISSGEVAGTPNVFRLRTAWDTVDLDSSRLLRMKESERYQVEAVWRRHMRQGFFGEISAGGSNREAVYGAAVGRYPQPGAAAWELSFRGNDRAMDSLPLVALDGRQNQVAFTIQKDLTDRLSVDAGIRYRWVDVRGQNLGDGVNVNLNASYTLVTETPTRPELSLAYFGELQRFNRGDFSRSFGNRMVQRSFRGDLSGRDLAENMLEERINRHGLIFTLTRKFSPHFSGYIYGGVAREFEYGDNEGLAGGGLEAFIGPRTSLFLNVDYTTSGRAGSRGSEVWSATSGARVVF